MALLGVLIDKQTISRAGNGTLHISLLTYNHSLPATNPELLLPNLRSVEFVGGDNTNGLPHLLGIGGNASLSTVGYAIATSASNPTVMFDLYAIVFHSLIR